MPEETVGTEAVTETESTESVEAQSTESTETQYIALDQVQAMFEKWQEKQEAKQAEAPPEPKMVPVEEMEAMFDQWQETYEAKRTERLKGAWHTPSKTKGPSTSTNIDTMDSDALSKFYHEKVLPADKAGIEI